jgi:hypothetical protein
MHIVKISKMARWIMMKKIILVERIPVVSMSAPSGRLPVPRGRGKEEKK